MVLKRGMQIAPHSPLRTHTNTHTIHKYKKTKWTYWKKMRSLQDKNVSTLFILLQFSSVSCQATIGFYFATDLAQLQETAIMF